MNALFEQTFQGTLGEIIAQAYLLAHGVQAAAPIKDSGNDLIAVRGEIFRAVQVRTSRDGSIDKPEPAKLYHILLVVQLPFDGDLPVIEKAKVFMFEKQAVESLKGTVANYPNSVISDSLVMEFWSDTISNPKGADIPATIQRFIPRSRKQLPQV